MIVAMARVRKPRSLPENRALRPETIHEGNVPGYARPRGFDMVSRRTELSRHELHQIRSRAFDGIHPTQCRTCSMPAPVRVPDAGTLAGRCEHHCASFMRWLWIQYGRQYDLAAKE